MQDAIANDVALVQHVQHQPIQRNKLATLIKQQVQSPPATLRVIHLPAGSAALAAWDSLAANERFKADMRAAGLSLLTTKVVLVLGGTDLLDLLVGMRAS